MNLHQSLRHSLNFRHTFLFVAALLSSRATHGFESNWVKGRAESSQVRLIGEFRELNTGTNEIKLALDFRLKAGWHIYWKNPGLIGFPPHIKANLPSGWKSDLLFPAPFRIAIRDHPGAFAYGYERTALYPLVLQGSPVRENEFSAQIRVEYLVCDIQCVPESANFDLLIPIGKESFSPFFKAINEAFNNVPEKSTAFLAARIDDRTTKITIQTAHPVTDLFLYSQDKIDWKKVERAENNSWLLVSKDPTTPFEFTGVYQTASARTGIIGSVNPKLLTGILSPTVSSVTTSDTKTSTAQIGDFFWALLFAFLGGLILNLMPCVLPVVALKTVSLLELRKKSVSYRQSVLLTIAGILFSFFALATVTSILKAFGHQVGWGFQFQSPGFVTLMSLVIFLFALNLFDLFDFSLHAHHATKISKMRGPFSEGVFATLLATPCSAPFLGTALTYALAQNTIVLTFIFLVMGLGLSTPYLLVLCFPRVLSLFPKPGHWMALLKRLLGYSLLVATFFLLYVVNQQTETLFLFAVLGSLFLTYILIREFKSWLRWILVVALMFFTVRLAESSKRMTSFAGQNSSAETSHIPFDPERLKALLAEGKTVFVLGTAEWCLTCKYNEKTVIQTDWFQNRLKSENIIFMTADWTQHDDSIGKFLEQYGRVGIPFAMLIDSRHFVLFPELLTRSNVENTWQTFRLQEP